MPRRFRPTEHVWRTQEYLHLISHRSLHLPGLGNRWLYPDIMAWDDDGQGNNVIPAFVIFYFDMSHLYPYEHRRAFRKQLEDHIPERWECYWMFGHGYLFAERREYGIPSFLPAEMQRQNLHAAHQYDAYIASLNENYSGNGHKEISEDENVMLLVPPSE